MSQETSSNPKIAIGKVRPGSTRQPKAPAPEPAPAAAPGWRCLAERIAESGFHYRNRIVHELKTAFPHEPKLWHVDKCYTLAREAIDKGPLYVDEPQLPYDVRVCERKREIMKKSGLRYVILSAGVTYEEALIQLGEA